MLQAAPIMTLAPEPGSPASDTPNTRIGSIILIPCGPLVKLIGSFRLFMKMRMISPKPSVTMAR